MEFTLEIDSENDAFTGEGAPYEVRRILGIVAGKVESGQRDGMIWDSNGNRVGSWSMTGEAEEEDEEGDE